MSWFRSGLAHRSTVPVARPTRARVLALLESAATTGEIARRLEMSPATASGHVRALREAELAGNRLDGRTVLPPSPRWARLRRTADSGAEPGLPGRPGSPPLPAISVAAV